MVFVHRREFHRRVGEWSWRCDCPRPWRIERDRDLREPDYPWLILRRIEPDGEYHLFLRAASWRRATSLVWALIRFDQSFAVEADRS